MPTANPLAPPIVQANQSITWQNLHGSSSTLALANLATNSQKPLLIITPDSLTANRLHDELTFFYQPTTHSPIIFFPDWETLPYDQFSPHQDIISSRLAALSQIPRLTNGIIITPIQTLMHRLTPRDFLEGNIFLLNLGDKIQIEA